MADPQDRPDEGSRAIPPAPRPGPSPKKAAPKKAPAKAAKKAPAKKGVAKKAPAKATKQAPPRPAQPPAAPPAASPPVSADGDTASARGAGSPVPPTAQPDRNSGGARIPLAIGLAAASLFAMIIRRLRRN